MATDLKLPEICDAALLLADGSLFLGRGFGHKGKVFGEICFNTSMTGYQEVMTDLSYASQIVVFTTPHVGNTGVNDEDNESVTHACRGLVTREMPSLPSNYRSKNSFHRWLSEHEMTGISDVDTRALTRHIRHKGAQNSVVWYGEKGAVLPIDELKAELEKQPTLAGTEMASKVTSSSTHKWEQNSWNQVSGYTETPHEGGLHVVAIDYGQKLNIARSLVNAGCKVTVVPALTPAEKILELKPDGVFLSNGPADPAATGEKVLGILRELIDADLPIFGICLGHQLLALALGAETEKMHQGHRGANHPVKNLVTGKVEITSQNHGFVVSSSSLPRDLEVTHQSLFDGTVEGLKHRHKPVFSVQYHPESSPGPHDSRYLFAQFVELMRQHENSSKNKETA